MLKINYQINFTKEEIQNLLAYISFDANEWTDENIDIVKQKLKTALAGEANG